VNIISINWCLRQIKINIKHQIQYWYFSPLNKLVLISQHASTFKWLSLLVSLIKLLYNIRSQNCNFCSYRQGSLMRDPRDDHSAVSNKFDILFIILKYESIIFVVSGILSLLELFMCLWAVIVFVLFLFVAVGTFQTSVRKLEWHGCFVVLLAVKTLKTECKNVFICQKYLPLFCCRLHGYLWISFKRLKVP